MKLKGLTLTILLCLGATWLNAQDDRGFSVEVGDTVPNVEIQMLDGTSIAMESLRGEVVLLQFTASWCSVCIKEMPHLEEEVWQRFKDDGLKFYGIDLKEKSKVVQAFAERTGITYPLTLDPDGEIFKSFTTPNAGVTRNILIDRDGQIVFLTRLFEREEFDQMIEKIAELLDDKQAQTKIK